MEDFQDHEQAGIIIIELFSYLRLALRWFWILFWYLEGGGSGFFLSLLIYKTTRWHVPEDSNPYSVFEVVTRLSTVIRAVMLCSQKFTAVLEECMPLSSGSKSKPSKQLTGVIFVVGVRGVMYNWNCSVIQQIIQRTLLGYYFMK
jgi:hypothetical protein